MASPFAFIMMAKVLSFMERSNFVLSILAVFSFLSESFQVLFSYFFCVRLLLMIFVAFRPLLTILIF